MTTIHAHSNPLWVREHGRDYAVPFDLTNACNPEDGIEDLSWHNDTCPKFGFTIDWADRTVQVVLWVDHPHPDRRESLGARYMTAVIGDIDILPTEFETAGLYTDDLDAAMTDLYVLHTTVLETLPLEPGVSP